MYEMLSASIGALFHDVPLPNTELVAASTAPLLNFNDL